MGEPDIQKDQVCSQKGDLTINDEEYHSREISMSNRRPEEELVKDGSIPMKIAIIADLFPPRWIGGTEIATYNTAKSLAARGHEVHIITALDEELDPVSRVDGFTIHRLPLIKTPRCRVNIGYIIWWGSVFRVIKGIKPDIVHVQDLQRGVPAYLAKKILGIPFVVWGQGDDVYGTWFGKSVIAPLVLMHAATVIALSEQMKKVMIAIAPCKVSIVPNGIFLDQFRSQQERDDLKERDTKTIIFVGRLREVKGVRYLIDAMKIIHAADPEVKLIIIGEGEERQLIERRIIEYGLEHCITLTGAIPNEEVSTFLATSDIFLLPSLSEGFGIVIIEAMAAGLPIIASRVGGIPDLITDGKEGFLVEPKNPQQIAERVLYLINEEFLRKEISLKNRSIAEKYDWSLITQQLEEIYKNCV